PFGIDPPSLFGLVFGVLGPALLLTGDPMLAGKIGRTVTVAMGALKLVLSFAGDHVRRIVPRAALLGSLAGVAALLIAFLPALKVFADPLVGLTSLTIVLVALLGQVRLPWGMPGAFAAVLAGSAIFWIRAASEGSSPALAARRAGARQPVPTARLGARVRRGAAIPVAGGALRSRDGHRGHRQYGVGHRGGRRVPCARHPAHRGGSDHGRRGMRRGHPEHALHRASRGTSHGRAGRLHAGPPPPPAGRRGGGGPTPRVVGGGRAG